MSVPQNVECIDYRPHGCDYALANCSVVRAGRQTNTMKTDGGFLMASRYLWPLYRLLRCISAKSGEGRGCDRGSCNEALSGALDDPDVILDDGYTPRVR